MDQRKGRFAVTNPRTTKAIGGVTLKRSNLRDNAYQTTTPAAMIATASAPLPDSIAPGSYRPDSSAPGTGLHERVLPRCGRWPHGSTF